MRFLEATYKIFKPRKKSSVVELSAEAKSHLPGHVAVIMDGNGRWAKKRGLPRRSGHYAGGENLYNLCSWCIDFGIKYTTVFAFSTENWHRPQKEIDSLMNLFLDFFNRYEDQLAAEGVRLRFCGEIEALPAKVQETIKKAEKQSIERDKLHLIVAFNYGGRREIV
ncbi:MAG: di-trans,poly-cis-decaprenylcistransferase [Clostridiaceae bacterium]|nr:di-trans,poly-cis-decaprenylcistransferase [Clostridiaceae bacterium]